jgi:hypothetical protein
MFFDYLNVLEIVEKHIQFEQIIVDESTLKFAKWKDEHVQMFCKMLAPKGQFIYDFDEGSNIGHGGWKRIETPCQNLTLIVKKYFDIKISDVFPINTNYTKKRVRNLQNGEGVVIATKK